VPSGAGTYALVVALDRSQHITIGRRGGFHFPAGFYIYIGSALGPGGLSARIGRHLLAEKRLHWHIDLKNFLSLAETLKLCQGED